MIRIKNCYGETILTNIRMFQAMLMNLSRFLCLFCLIFALSTSASYAVEISDKGAQSLKAMLSKQLDNYKKTIEGTGGTLKTQGDISIEQGDSYYAATLPALTYVTAFGENVKIGLVAINAIPTDNPQDWKISMAIPTPILVTNASDAEIKRIDIGEQNMGGLWSGALNNFSKLSSQYSNIKFTDLKNNSGFDIGKIIIKSDLTEKKTDSWAGPTQITLSNFVSNNPNLKNAFSADEIAAFIQLDGFSFKKQQAAKENLKALEKGKEKSDIAKSIFEVMKATGKFSTQINFKNLKVNDLVTNKNNIKSVDSVQFGYNSETPENGKLNQGFNLAYNGLQLKNTEKNIALIPTQFKTSLAVENFPFLDAFELAQDSITKDTNARQVAATKALNFLPQKFKESGSILKISDTSFSNAQYNVNLLGEIKALPDSKLGVGFLNIETTGLDNIMTTLENTPNGKDLASQLTLFRLISEQSGDKNIARLKLDAQGNMTVNDKDVSALMGMANSAKPAPAATVKKSAQ